MHTPDPDLSSVQGEVLPTSGANRRGLNRGSIRAAGRLRQAEGSHVLACGYENEKMKSRMRMRTSEEWEMEGEVYSTSGVN